MMLPFEYSKIAFSLSIFCSYSNFHSLKNNVAFERSFLFFPKLSNQNFYSLEHLKFKAFYKKKASNLYIYPQKNILIWLRCTRLLYFSPGKQIYKAIDPQTLLMFLFSGPLSSPILDPLPLCSWKMTPNILFSYSSNITQLFKGYFPHGLESNCFLNLCQSHEDKMLLLE